MIIDVFTYENDDNDEIIRHHFVATMKKESLLKIVADDVLEFAGRTVWFPETEMDNILEYLDNEA